MRGEERTSGDRVGLSGPALREALAGGNLRLLGLVAGASNGTFLAEATGEAGTTLAIYKPRRGEAPLWDFPEGTLWRREIAAFEVANALGWPDVPLTVQGDGPHGIGAVQVFVEHDPDQHYFTLRAGRAEAFMRVALFDAIVNNADRKGGHCLLGPDDRVWLVDHGTCFNVEPTMRTVVWDFAGDAVPPELLADVRAAAKTLREPPLAGRLTELLSPEEAEETAARAEALAARGRFPEPGPYRHVPWPPIMTSVSRKAAAGRVAARGSDPAVPAVPGRAPHDGLPRGPGDGRAGRRRRRLPGDVPGRVPRVPPAAARRRPPLRGS